jgi:predicted transcriptional regulator
MALQGSIKDFGLPDIFQLIGLQRKTGMLTLTQSDETVTVAFENGMVVNADTSAKRIEDRLGNLLVKQGKLSDEKLEEVLQKQKATLQRLGHILVANGYVSQKDLQSALQVQVSQNVFKLFRWKVGDYHFEPSEKVEYDRANVQPMSADFILMEGIRMVDEWPIIEKKIPSMDIVFRSAVDNSMIEVAADDDMFGDSKKAGSNKIKLSPDEAKVFKRVDGQRTVQAVIDATGLGDFDVCKALYDLLSRDIIAPTGRGAKAKDVGGAPEEESGGALGWGVAGVALALALAGAAVQLRTPFGVLGRPPLLNDSWHLLMDGVSRSRLQRLDRALMAFRYEHGTLPKTLEELSEEGLVDRAHLNDPWDRPYHYGATAAGYVLNAVDDGGKPAPGTIIERSFAATR